MFCQVVIDIIHENVASPFTYRIPDGMDLVPGQRVAVPFGRMEKEGIVVRTKGTQDARQMIVSMTKKGKDLQKKLSDVPATIGDVVMCDSVNPETAPDLFRMLDAIISQLESRNQ